MSNSRRQQLPPGVTGAPGTFLLNENHYGSGSEVYRYPVPSQDPDDPLNWSTGRKAVHFSLVCYYVLWTFIALQVAYPTWNDMTEDLGFSTGLLNNAVAVNYIGLGFGCVFLIPIVHKYGRRLLYIISITLQLVASIWAGFQYHPVDAYGYNLVAGIGGAISETIAQITIADVYFVHQHGTMNGFYLLAAATGDFVGPVIGGYIAEAQDWRWVWWWSVIFIGVGVVAVVLFFEESKYCPNAATRGADLVPHAKEDQIRFEEVEQQPLTRRKTYKQRMKLITRSEGEADMPYLRRLYQPLVYLFTFPAIAYAAVTYGSLIAWISIFNSIQATYLPLPPYNFSSSAVGLMNLPAFVGALFGFGVGGWMNDKLSLWLAKKSQGVFEPEHRLWLGAAATVTVPASTLMFGLGLDAGAHWMVLAVAYALFGFGFIVGGDVVLSYCTDCYQDIIGDALVGVVFVRNGFALAVSFGLTPWVDALGVRNLFIMATCFSLAILLLPVVFLIWGKRFRIMTAAKYKEMAQMQPGHRTIETQGQ